MQVIGHRGASAEAPENTIASFRAAIGAGADGIECDVRLSADGAPVIIHDATTERLGPGGAEVRDLTLAQLKSLDASGGGAAFAGARIPALAEVLDAVAGRCILVLEFKSLPAVGAAAPLIASRSAAPWCKAWAFDLEVLAECRRLLPDLPRSQNVATVEDWDRVLGDAARLACEGVSLRASEVTQSRVKDAHARGLLVSTWTPNAPPEWRRRADAAGDAICTDDPRGLRRFMQAAGAFPP
jgi:glycerophosphoryl diester phosphodiesterase